MRSKCPGRSAIDFIPVYGINRGRSSLSTSFELKLPQAGVGSTWPKVQRIARVVDRQVEPPQYAESDEPIGFAEQAAQRRLTKRPTFGTIDDPATEPNRNAG